MDSGAPNPRLTDSPAKPPNEQFLHRETQVSELADMIRSGKKCLLVSGFGGIGKTALARRLYHDLAGEFKRCAWVNYGENLRDSFLAQTSAYAHVKEAHLRWNSLKSYTTNCGSDFMLFVDNASGAFAQDEGFDWLSSLDCPVVITSRGSDCHGFIPYEIGFLEHGQGVDVFYCYYKYDPDRKSAATVGALVELAGRHTLSIELAAGLANSTVYRYSLPKLLSDMKEKGFDLSNIRLKTGHAREERSIAQHIAMLFDLAELSDGQKRLLANFAIMPEDIAIPMQAREWLGADDSELEALVSGRWISCAQDGYRMYGLVRQAFRLQVKKVPYAWAERLIETAESDNFFDEKDGYEAAWTKLSIAAAYADEFQDTGTAGWASFLNSVGVALSHMGDYKGAMEYHKKALRIQEKALEYHKKALRIQEQALGTDHPDTASSYNNLAAVYKALGEFDKALEYHQKALRIKEQALGSDHPATATSYNNLAAVYYDLRDLGKALEYHEKALRIQEQALGTDHPDTAVSYNILASVYHARGDLEKALEYHKKALRIQEQALGTDHPDTASSYNNLAAVYKALGEFDKALEYHQKALRIKEQALGSDHPATATSYNNLAAVYYDLRDLGKALEYHEKALRIQEQALGTDHPDTAVSYNILASVYHARGDLEKALEYHKKALRIREQALGIDHPITACSYNNLAAVYHAQGEFDKALEHHQKALRIQEQALGSDHPHTAVSYNNLAIVYHDLGDLDKALEYHKKALGICELMLGKEHPKTQIVRKNLEFVQQLSTKGRL